MSSTRQIPLRLLPKTSGGRLDHIATFCTECDNLSANALLDWEIIETLRSGEDASDGFSHIGLTRLLSTPVVVKIMQSGRGANAEKEMSRLFRQRPHRNVIQSICVISCMDNVLRWIKPVRGRGRKICTGTTPMIIAVQEYIPRGNLRDIALSVQEWTSISLQLTFTIMELFEKYDGFLHGDLHLGNILYDTMSEGAISYRVFGKTWRVPQTAGVRPVLTDFARAIQASGPIISPDREAWVLAAQISILWDMLSHKAPLSAATHRQRLAALSIEMDELSELPQIIAMVAEWARSVA